MRGSEMHEINPPAPILPTFAQERRLLHRLVYEAWDHLWPWSRHGFQRQRFIVALSLGLGVVVTVVWLFAAAGRVGANAVIGWWVGWSVFEILVRRQSKPYVKEGPWWGTQYRRADVADTICYVAFKNLLIGIALFLIMRYFGVLDFLQGLPELKWLYI